jgi:hypothetical protein
VRVTLPPVRWGFRLPRQLTLRRGALLLLRLTPDTFLLRLRLPPETFRLHLRLTPGTFLHLGLTPDTLLLHLRLTPATFLLDLLHLPHLLFAPHALRLLLLHWPRALLRLQRGLRQLARPLDLRHPLRLPR